MNDKLSFSGWLRGSLVGHILAGQLFYALPVYLILLGLHVNDGGTVTLLEFLKGLILVPIGGSLFGVFFWFTFTSRVRKKYKKKQ